MVVGKHLRRVVRAVGFDLLFSSHPGTAEAVTADAAQSPCVDFDAGCAPVPAQAILTPRMMTDDEREQALCLRARAAAELLDLQEGLLGRGWRVRTRAIYLKGVIHGATLRLQADHAARN